MGPILALALLAPCLAQADERLKDIACRSVHLAYQAPEAIAFTNTVTPERSAPGTYFCVCGFNRGYFGLQELANGKKLVIFSVWDPTSGDDPSRVDEAKRVKLLHKDPGVRVGRFGGEGTGGQSFFDYDWKIGQTYRFLVQAKVVGERTEYAGYFYVPEDQGWKHLVTFSTLGEGKALGGYYAFIEDFLRNKVSATQARRAGYGHGWVQAADGVWTPLLRARFTADANPVTNIDAGRTDDGFFLQTGGDTKNTGTPLKALIERLEDSGGKVPTDLPGGP